MANFINKYLNQSAYDADNTKQYPNTSLVGNDIVFQMTEPTPTVFGGLTVKYNIVDATQEVTLFSGGGGSSTSSSSSESSSEPGGGGALPTTMIVDGVEETPINTWRFETAGEHIVQYEFADNIVPSNFLVQTLATEAIIGDDITEIGNEAFNCNLTTATIGTGITSIGDTAFYDYGNLASITIEATTPPTLGNYSLSGDYPIYVPAESVNAYKTETVWLDYASRIFAIQE